MKALLWGAAAALLAGGMVISPAGSFALACLAAAMALPALLGAAGRLRLTAVAVLALALALAAGSYPAFTSSLATYRSRAGR